jgi:hypothetical protein
VVYAVSYVDQCDQVASAVRCVVVDPGQFQQLQIAIELLGFIAGAIVGAVFVFLVVRTLAR